MAEFDETTRLAILRSLDAVGISKAVGYLPLYTIEKVLNTTVDTIEERFLSRGLGVMTFGKRQTCIQSGALFVYDQKLVDHFVQIHRSTVDNKGWNPRADRVISNLAKLWRAKNDPIMPLVRDLFGDASCCRPEDCAAQHSDRED